jgi:hypothetical protein
VPESTTARPSAPRVSINCLSWASQTLRNPDAHPDHVAIALELQNSDTLSAWAEFVPPAPVAVRPAPRPPVWGGLTADERNTRTIAACLAMFHDEPGNLPSRQVASAQRTAMTLTSDPESSEVLPRVRKAYFAALAPVVTEAVAEAATVEPEQAPASSPLPSVSFSDPAIKAGPNAIVFVLDGLTGDECQTITAAYHTNRGSGRPAAEQAAREALRRVLAARPVAADVEPEPCCPTCADRGPYCNHCGTGDPSPLDFTPNDRPTFDERAWWAAHAPSNQEGGNVWRSNRVLDWPHDVRRTLRRSARGVSSITDFDMIRLTGCV